MKLEGMNEAILALQIGPHHSFNMRGFLIWSWVSREYRVAQRRLRAVLIHTYRYRLADERDAILEFN